LRRYEDVGLRAVGAQFSLFCGLQRLLFYSFLLLQIAAHEEADDHYGDDEGDERIHKFSEEDSCLEFGLAR